MNHTKCELLIMDRVTLCESHTICTTKQIANEITILIMAIDNSSYNDALHLRPNDILLSYYNSM